MTELKFESIPIGNIKSYTENCKLHPAEQIAKIRDSIVSFGYLDPIAIDENNIIIEGHGRLLAMKQINSNLDKEVRVIRIIGLDEDAKKAYRIAHNKLNMDTGFDLEKLGKEFNLLESTDFFNDTGFETKDITEIWEKENSEEIGSSSEIVDSEKSSTMEYTCPRCNYTLSVETDKPKPL